MSATIGNIINENRNDLSKVLPLETPYAVAIDPCNACNFHCNFCAAQSDESHSILKRCIMDFTLYKKIIDDLCNMSERLKILRLNGNGEPLLNSNFCEMVKYAKNKNVANYIETITNGSKLTHKLNMDLADFNDTAYFPQILLKISRKEY